MESHVASKNGIMGPVLKQTGMLTNSWCLQRDLSLGCTTNHEHVHLVGGRAAAAQEYPKKSCEAICRGIADQRANDLSRKFTTLPMCERVASLASLCIEATGHLSSFCREATGDNNKTDWPSPIDQPIGDYPNIGPTAYMTGMDTRSEVRCSTQMESRYCCWS